MTKSPGSFLLIIGIILVVLTYGTAYKIGVACLLVGLLLIIFQWGPSWWARRPRD